ncbi:hypothetical protein F0Y71_24230, partial [Salmonella enterica subsp. enterica]|nr:hypothetical protein [Salmonella enterica subsp. enterica]ECX5102172.1 hypothetical protein [Salmonella enterica subsp. enterica serovar Kentucky]
MLPSPAFFQNSPAAVWRSDFAGNRISEEKKKSCCKISTKNGGLLRYGNYCSVGKIQNRVSLKLQKTGQKNFFQLIFINR